MKHVERLMIKAKRRIATLLIVVMTLQSLLTSATAVAMAAPSGADPESNIIALKGNPEEAFEYIYVQLGKTVSGDGDEISLTFWYSLVNEWIEEQYESYLADGLLDPYSFEYDSRYNSTKEQYGTYQDYLMEQTDISITAPSFTCRFNDGFADVEELMELVEANSKIFTETGKEIGEITVRDENGPVFYIEFYNNIFVRQNIYGNKGMAMKLLNQYEEGTTVEVQSGSGDNSLDVAIKGDGTPIATDSNYSIEKEYEQGVDVEGYDDPSAINYRIIAKATPSSLASNPNAGMGSDPNASLRIASLLATETGDSSEDDDDIPEDARDGELLNDLFKVPTRSTIVRSSLNSGEESEYEDLTGKYITDAISSNLTLDAVYVYYNGTGRWILPQDEGYESWEDYLDDRGRIFTYEIVSETGEPVWQCEVTLYTRISDQLWLKYAQTGTLDYTFPNRAVLKSNEESGTLAVSNKVEPEIHWKDLLTKEGQIIDINSKEVRWVIETDAHFTAGVELYLVDHIADIENTHNYIWDDDNEGIITIDGEEQTVTRLELEEETLQQLADELEIDVEDIWTELGYGTKEESDGLYGTPTVSTIEKLFAVLVSQDILAIDEAYNSGYHYAYEYTYVNEDGEAVTDAIMLISMKKYTNGTATIIYNTVVTAEANADTGAYGDGDDGEIELANDLRPVWKWSGRGPGEPPTGYINARKDWKIRTNVVNKTAGDYNDAYNTVTWLFDVNQTGKVLQHVWITDELDADIMQWDGVVKAQESIDLIPYNRSPETDEDGNPLDEPVAGGQVREIEYLTPEAYEAAEESGSTEDYYTVDGTTLKVHLGPVSAAEYYKFQVETVVINPQYAKGDYLEVTNTATAAVEIEGHGSTEVDLWASAVINHELIEKEAIESATGSNYNYKDNTVKWRVRINPKRFTIAGAEITDTLPEGTIFDRVTNIFVNGNAVDWAYDGNDRIKIRDPDIYIQLEEKNGILVFSFVDASGNAKKISQTYVLEYTTEVTEEFRKEKIRSNGDVTTLDNKVVLNGTIEGVDIRNAEDKATHKIQPQSLLKEGTYHSLSEYTYKYYENGVLQEKKVKAVYFNWTAYINRLGEDMSLATVSDALANCFEMVPATFCVEAVELDAEGKEKEGTSFKIVEDNQPCSGVTGLDNLTVNEFGFNFNIPDAYKNKTLKITFDTILVDDASAAEMKNAINVQGVDWSDTSKDATDKNAKDFRYTDYLNADGMYFLRVVKKSSNDKYENLYLEGAGFSLTRWKLPEGEDAKDINAWKEESGWKKERITNVNGVLNFLFLEPNTLYRLEETQAPNGYDELDKFWYVAILDPDYDYAGSSQPEQYPAEGDATDGSYEVILVNPADIIDPVHFKNMEIDNEPSNAGDNELKFKKVGQNGQILPGVTFWLDWETSFLSTKSDADGIVTFEKLDPGQTYSLREIGTPTGYQVAARWQVEVSLDADGKYSIVLQERIGDEWQEVSGEDGIYILKNEPITNTGSFKKVDQNGDLIKDFSVEFEVYRRGDGGETDVNDEVTVVLGDNADDYERYIPMATVSSAEGTVTLTDFYYGYYMLTEVWNRDNLAAKAKASVYVKVDQSGVWAAEYGTVPTTDEDYKYNLSDTSSVFEVNNEVKWGLVDVRKVVGTYNADTGNNEPDLNDEEETSPVKGALFAIYKADKTLWFYVKTVATAADATYAYLDFDGKENAYIVYDRSGNATGDTKVLPVGSYYLQEISIKDYVVDTKLYPFEIETGTFDDSGEYVPADKVYVASQVGVDNGDPIYAELDDEKYFLNMPIRHPVNLEKVDEDNDDLKLTDAEFGVYNTAGKPVAWIRYDNAKTKYVLMVPKENYTDRDSSGRKYLELKKNSNDEYEYALLIGSYNVTETKAPTATFSDTFYAYPTTDKKATLVVNSTRSYISAGGLWLNSSTLKNQLKRGEFTLNKYVLSLKQGISDTGNYDYSLVEGFTFELTGTTLSGGTINKSGTTSQGKLTFEDIPLGTYKLSETVVPDSYIANTETGELIVKKVPDIWVKIEAADNDSDKTTVKFYQDDLCTFELGYSESVETASQSNSTIGKIDMEGNYLLAYNALKTANVAGIKVSHFVDESRKDLTASLGNAKFKLEHKTLKYANGNFYTFMCETDSAGNIQFINVPYGQYTLTEVETPNGYLTIDPITFTISEAAEQNGILKKDADGVYTYYLQQNGHDIYDEVALVDVKLRKVNQNGDAISWDALNAKFKVEQISGYSPYYPFEVWADTTCQINDSGILQINNLVPGIYEVTEDLSGLPEGQRDLVSGSVQFWIKVETEVGASNAVKSVKVSVYSANPTMVSGATPVAVISGINQNGIADFTNTNFTAEMNKLMKNVWAYGDVDINKVRGEWKSDGKYEAADPLAGVQFAIYEADATGEQPKDASTPYLILETDTNGNFPDSGTDGIYTGVDGTGNKALLVGNYVIKELSLGSSTKDNAYNILSEYTPFAVTNKTTTWIYTDNDSEGNLKATASDSTEAATAWFFNVPKRGTLSFDKVDADNNNNYLKGAEFALYLIDGSGKTGEEIGTIGYDDSADANTYRLTAPVNTSKLNADGIPYIVADESGNYHLLVGEYIVRETIAPKGYQLTTEEFSVIIAANADTQVNGGTITNTIQKALVSFAKNVEVNPSQPEVNGNETIFILRGIPANGDAEWEEVTFVAEQMAGKDGRFDIIGLPLGSYALYELAPDSNSYQGFGDATEAEILKIVVEAGEGGIPEVTYTVVETKDTGKSPTGITVNVQESGAAGEIEITNNWKRGSVTGRKVAADNHEVGLDGAVFGLYTDADCTSLVTTATSSTATEPIGQFVFTDIAYGTYYVKEIKAPVGYAPSTVVYEVMVDTQEASVTEGGKLDDQNKAGESEAILFTNGNKRGAVELTKKAAHNGELLAGSAEFTIYADAAGNDAVAYLRDSNRDGVYTLASGSGLIAAVNGVRYLQADENGDLLLIQGTYWLKETKVPAGYQAEMEGSSQKAYEFTIYSEDDITTQLLDTYIISNREEDEFFYNDIATGQFTLAKTIEVSRADDLTAADTAEEGEGFWFEIAGTDVAANSGQKIAETEFLRIDDRKLAEAVAAGVARKMEDGSIQVVTGSDGTVVVSGLLIGTYTVTELDGPDYDLYTGTAPKKVVLKQSDDNAEIITAFDNINVEPEKEYLAFHNALKRYDLTGKKVDDAGAALEGAVFGLYAADGTTKYREAATGTDGWFRFDKLPTGDYMVKEVRPSSDAYVLNTQEYNITITAQQSTSFSILLSAEAVVNVLKRSDIKGLKVTAGGAGLAGATIGLFPEGASQFSEANLYEGMTAVSDANGYFVFKNIPYGTYRIAELKAPNGYLLNKTTSYLVSVTENGTEITTGYKAVRLVAEITASEIKIVNSRNSGGDDGGGTTSTRPGTQAPASTGDNGLVEVIGDEDVPLGQMPVTIADNETPLAGLAKTGDTALPYALLIVIMLGAIGSMTALVLKRRKEKEE